MQQVEKRNGRRENLDISKIHSAVEWACKGLDVSQSEIETGAKILFFDGIRTEQIQLALIGSAASLIDIDKPDYEFAAARLTLLRIYKEVCGGEVSYPTLETYINRGIAAGRLQKSMKLFDFGRLDAAIDTDRDFKFKYLGMQTIYDRYLIRDKNAEVGVAGDVIEMPQHFWMRVAMGIALNEVGDDRTMWAIKFYDLLSTFSFVNSTPTLFNAGTTHPQMSSCFVTTVADEIWEESDTQPIGNGIMAAMTECGLYSKFSGGVGSDWTRVRPTGSHIKSTNGMSSGIVPYLKIFNDTAVAINQGGRRNGSFAAYLEPWHGDIERFITLKKPNGDERLRAREIFPALWTNDLFMERVRDKGKWSLFCSNKYPMLHTLHGEDFKVAYEEAEREGGAIKVVNAEVLWRKIITALVESGAPWITFKDEMNRRNPQDHVGVINSGNLCCMTADQKVVTDSGILTVGDLYMAQTKSKVVGLNGFSNASEMLLPRPDAPIVRIDTAEGYSHKVTPDHRIWVKGRGWVEAQDIVPGEKILTQQIEGMWGDAHDPKLGLIAGLIAGDGTFDKSGVIVDLYGGKNLHFKDAIERMVGEIIDKSVMSAESLPTRAVRDPKFASTKDGAAVRLHSAALGAILERNGLTKSTKLSIPDFVWMGDKVTASAYLRGLYLADGTVQATDEITTLSLSSSSKEFLQDIQILWANYGVKTSICKVHNGGMRDFGDGYGEYECKPVWRVLITSVQGCRIANRAIHLGELRRNNTAKQFLKNLETKKGYRQKLYATFTGLTQLPNEDAYCLTVDSETHAWTVNGLITHNTEITLNSSDDETAVCNLGSVNLAAIDPKDMKRVIPIAMRMLDNVIDLNFYPTQKAQISNMRHRPVGLGLMGWTDFVVRSGVDWESVEHLQLTDDVFEQFSYWAIRGSVELAEERGAYATYKGSKWDRGILPIDTARKLDSKWSAPLNSKTIAQWDTLRVMLEKHGIRNSNCTSIAPTATIANIVGVEVSIEPIFKKVFTKDNISGKFKVVAPSLRHNRPDLCKIAFDIDQTWIIKAAAVRQKYLCQSQSVNLFKKAGAKGVEISSWYFLAWELGLKSTYYLRQQINEVDHKTAGSIEPDVEKERTEAEELACSLDEMVDEVKVCSIDNPDCESCQ